MSLFDYLASISADDDEIIDALVDDFAIVIDVEDEMDVLTDYGY